MHFSRMCTIHCSGHLLDGGGVGVCLGGYLPDTPPWTESWTGVKTLLCCNYFADSKKSEILGSPVRHPAPNIRVPEQISGSLWLPGTR